MFYLHTRRNRQARNSTSWGLVACLQVWALELTCQIGGQKMARKASKVVISLKNLAIVIWKRNRPKYHRKCRHSFRLGRKQLLGVVFKLLRCFWDLPKRVRSFSKFVFLLIITKAKGIKRVVYRPPPASFFPAASKSHFLAFWRKVFVFFTIFMYFLWNRTNL